ncbi:hypothetical protein [Borreliella garinii]|uniref:hypothetical protein n=1 Tax=Borreliella garinii TaxID=29519 RepID=UPI001AEECEA3|nr:hypothetical protein [Borreliella garinii]
MVLFKVIFIKFSAPFFSFNIDSKDLLCTKCIAYYEFFRFINKGEHRVIFDVPLNILIYLNVSLKF